MTTQHHPPKHKGFTFLEVLVISGIIAGLSVGTYSYMAMTQSSVRVSNAVRDLQAIRAAANNWGTGRVDFFSGISMSKVAHLLPPRLATATATSAGTGSNPWKGNYSLASKADDDTLFVITATKVPNALGTPLQDRLNASRTVATFAVGAGTTPGTLSVTYE